MKESKGVGGVPAGRELFVAFAGAGDGVEGVVGDGGVLGEVGCFEGCGAGGGVGGDSSPALLRPRAVERSGGVSEAAQEGGRHVVESHGDEVGAMARAR